MVVPNALWLSQVLTDTVMEPSRLTLHGAGGQVSTDLLQWEDAHWAAGLAAGGWGLALFSWLLT